MDNVSPYYCIHSNQAYDLFTISLKGRKSFKQEVVNQGYERNEDKMKMQDKKKKGYRKEEEGL